MSKKTKEDEEEMIADKDDEIISEETHDKEEKSADDKEKGAITGGDEDLTCAIAHGSILLSLAITVFSIFVPLIIWLTHKEKSKKISFHSKQALIYQVAVYIILSIITLITVILMFFGIGFCCIPIIVVLPLIAIAYGGYAAYKTYTGEEFRYVYIADIIEKK